MTSNNALEADRGAVWPRRARNRLRARRLGMAAGPAAQLNR
jgi:hypothetical protein